MRIGDRAEGRQGALAISDDYVTFTTPASQGGGIGGGVPIESGSGALVARVKVTHALES